jgi:uncharacterized protein
VDRARRHAGVRPMTATTSPVASSRSRKPLFEVRRSAIQGRGVFARVAIEKGERIVEYKGERISVEEADRRYDDETRGRHHTFLFAVNERVVIDASHVGNDARYINHSCAPNCEAIMERGRIFIYAKRAIAAGVELAYDYAYTTDDSYTLEERRRLYPCRCGAKTCRGTLAAKPSKRTKKPAATAKPD